MKNQKFKSNKGITLIALIITIIVLLILAVVAIGAIQNDGIVNHAKNARDEYGMAGVNENATLEQYLGKIEANLPEGNGGGNNSSSTMTVAEAQTKGVLSTNANTDVVDEYGNKIVVPAGFKITADASKVTEGIVIEDCTETATKGSQFVWIPTPKDRKVYTNKEKTEYKTITLGRYSSFTANAEGEYTPAQTAANYTTPITIDSYYTEDTSSTHIANYGNTIAKNIGAFIESATTKGGYYLGRYEAGDAVTNYDRSSATSDTNTMVCKAGKYVYSYVTQAQASNLSQNMYTSTNFTSDLVNSYAWDTAIVFIQTFSTETGASNYATSNKSTSYAKTGINTDKYCNIHDMSGNVSELTTETSSEDDRHFVERGGYYDMESEMKILDTSSRLRRLRDFL